MADVLPSVANITLQYYLVSGFCPSSSVPKQTQVSETGSIFRRQIKGWESHLLSWGLTDASDPHSRPEIDRLEDRQRQSSFNTSGAFTMLFPLHFKYLNIYKVQAFRMCPFTFCTTHPTYYLCTLAKDLQLITTFPFFLCERRFLFISAKLLESIRTFVCMPQPVPHREHSLSQL